MPLLVSLRKVPLCMQVSNCLTNKLCILIKLDPQRLWQPAHMKGVRKLSDRVTSFPGKVPLLAILRSNKVGKIEIIER